MHRRHEPSILGAPLVVEHILRVVHHVHVDVLRPQRGERAVDHASRRLAAVLDAAAQLAAHDDVPPQQPTALDRVANGRFVAVNLRRACGRSSRLRTSRVCVAIGGADMLLRCVNVPIARLQGHHHGRLLAARHRAEDQPRQLHAVSQREELLARQRPAWKRARPR